MRRILVCIGAILAITGCSSTTSTLDHGLTQTLSTYPEILWDEWGVPHIRANNMEDAFYSFGWAQMRGRPNLVLKLYGQGRGRAAEYWGTDYYDLDEKMWTLGIPQQLDVIYQAQGADYRARLDAFVKGVNDYAERFPEYIDDDMARVLPVTPQDVLGHVRRTIHLEFLAFNELRMMADKAPVIPAKVSEVVEESVGSNAWAIGRPKSESGNTLLLANSHVPWDDLFYFFEAHIQGPGANFYGGALIGHPYLAVAFNNYLGWAHTVNTYDGADTYEFDLAEGGYVGPDGVLAFDVEEVILKVLSKNNQIESRSLIVKHTIAGPVVHETDKKVYSLKIAGLEPEHSRLVEQYWKMAQSETLTEFQASMAEQQMPMFTTIYADKGGNIFYLFNGLLPKRKVGDHLFWAGYLDGANSDHYWQDYLPFEDLPKHINPESGFVQNSNEPPWMSTVPAVLDPKDFPKDLVPPSLHARAQHSLEMLMEDDSITYEEFVRYSHSVRLVSAENVLDDLIELAKTSGKKKLFDAATVLSNWDRQANLDSRGAVLYFLWANELNVRNVHEIKWSYDDPLRAPSGIADPVNALRALEIAADNALALYGALDAPWYEVSRIKRNSLNLPVAVAPGRLGAFRVGWIDPEESGGFELTGGTTYLAAIEFGDQPSARGLLPYGNFTIRPTKFRSQWEVFANGELRPIHFSDDAINAAVVEHEVLTPDVKSPGPE